MQTKRKNQNSNGLSMNVSQVISYCPFCDVNFCPESVSVISEQGDIQLLHATCGECSTSIVILLLSNEMGLRSVGLVTDLTDEDVMRIKDGTNITIDDILHIHRLLKDGIFFSTL